ncbi:hypothetical protein J19TS2_48930 [Cohnella xylanilytica]|uniref:hypothetical protein n=1 Tax=Cohnella xylanilytica TaxID=557555 RepID=UPI001B2D0C0C|nr:hypothetical protein [Cohnella xylanilytica]GIO15338.1 hypothetical protein J19TS2_48930 [Cohnella xylanilytica]
MKIKKLAATGAIAIAVTGAVVIASKYTEASIEPTSADKMEQGSAHIQYKTPMFDRMKDKAVVQKIQDSWVRAEAVLASKFPNERSGTDGWQLLNSADGAIEFTNGLAQQEAFSFNAAFMSKERRAALQVGDYWPALLLNKEEGRAILFWERDNGNVVKIDLLSKTNKGGARDWYVEGPAQEFEAQKSS